MIGRQPDFWLEVRKKYIVDNYSSLLAYLHGYHYVASEEGLSSDFNKTYNCLRDVISDIRKSMEEDNVFYHAATQWAEDDLKRKIGLTAAYLLASQKKNITDDDTLAMLCNILFE